MRKYLPYGLLIATIIISTSIWDFIKFPYDSNNLINGNYSSKKFNPLNDSARGLFFIFIPLIAYILFQLKINKNNFILNRIKFHNNIMNMNKMKIFILFV